MENYWFLYNLSDGNIYGVPYMGSATEWTNIPEKCGVIGFMGDQVTDVVKDAFEKPLKYKVVDNKLIIDSNYAEPTITIQPTQDEILRAKLIKDNADMQLQLSAQQKLNADILLKLAKIGGSTNV